MTEPANSAATPQVTTSSPTLPADVETRTVFLGGIFLLLFLTALHVASVVAIPFVLALVLKLVLHPLMVRLERMHIPRALASFVIVLTLLSCVIGFGALLSEPAASWGTKISTNLPALQERLSIVSKPLEKTQKLLTKADHIEPIHNQTLSRGMLTALTPPLPGERQHQLLARMAAGSASSLLELKMRAAGASVTLIEDVQALRADMEVQRQLLLASRDSAETDLEELARRVLRMAHATSARINLSAVGNPVAAGRPAEAVAADLRSRPHDFAHCDRKQLLHQDEELLFGYLGHLSDLCRFDWGLT